ncbi:FIG140336: TPR domain protein, partial [hydrothermal vent metagenome]
MIQKTLKTIKEITALSVLTLLVACQSNPAKEQPSDMSVKEQAINAETMAMGWEHLQQSTLTSLREQSFGEADIKIKQMMAFADKDHDKWEYIRMAIISMPEDFALKLIDLALDKPFIQSSNKQIFSFSRVLIQLKQEPKALALVNSLILKDKTTEYVYWRARLLLLMEEESQAENDYLWLLKKDPGNVTYISQYATLLSYLKRNDEALALLQDNEQDVDLLFRQVILLLQKDDESLANAKFALLKEQLNVGELTAQQKLEIGELAFWMEEHELSLELLQSVKTGDQVNAAKLLIANVLVDQNNYARAAVMYHQVQNGPEEHAIPAYQLEIELYRQQDNFAQALEVADLGLSMFKDDADLLYSRAMLHGEMDNLTALESDLKKIIAEQPQNPDALNALGYTWADNDMNLELAYDYIMQANAIKPNDKAILDSVGWVYFKKGDLVQAEKYLRMAIDGNTRDSESYLHLIEVLQQIGDQSAVDSIIQLAQELFPE